MVGRIDWDVFVDGQDWKLTELKITLVFKSAYKSASPRHLQEFRSSEQYAVPSRA
jgi:hypothetical protein